MVCPLLPVICHVLNLAWLLHMHESEDEIGWQWLILQLPLSFFWHTALHTAPTGCGASWEAWIFLAKPPLTMLQEVQDSKTKHYHYLQSWFIKQKKACIQKEIVILNPPLGSVHQSVNLWQNIKGDEFILCSTMWIHTPYVLCVPGEQVSWVLWHRTLPCP